MKPKLLHRTRRMIQAALILNKMGFKRLPRKALKAISR